MDVFAPFQHAGLVAQGGFLFPQAQQGDQLLGQVQRRLALTVAAWPPCGVGFGFEVVGPFLKTCGPVGQVQRGLDGDVALDQAAHPVQFIGGVGILHVLADLAVIGLLGALEKAADFGLQGGRFIMGAALALDEGWC